MGERSYVEWVVSSSNSSFSQHQHFYYLGRHGIDDNNRERQGSLSFEESFLPNDWNLRQFGFIVDAALANAHMACEYFVKGSVENRLTEPKAVFVHSVMKGLMENAKWIEAKRESARVSGQSPATASSGDSSGGTPLAEHWRRDEVDPPIHKKVMIPVGMLKWDAGRQMFPQGTNKYTKYRCQWRPGGGQGLWQTGQDLLYLQKVLDTM